MPDVQKLLGVFEKVRELVTRHDNDFSWAWWDDCDSALREIDPILEALRQGTMPVSNAFASLFLPTSGLQELSLSSGWGDEFVEVANEFDAAMAEPCVCRTNVARGLVSEKDFGLDENYAEVSLLQCPVCHQFWLRYLYEHEAFSGSGRWYLAPISPQIRNEVNLENAKVILESMPVYWCGGSYYNGTVSQASGPILLTP
jgi:hypothetical protein